MSRSAAHPHLASGWRTRFDRIDRRITAVLARFGVPVVRLSLGVVFLWFGALKLIPGLSPAEDLAARTIDELSGGAVGPALSVPALAAWECLIGLGLLSGRFLRGTLLLMGLGGGCRSHVRRGSLLGPPHQFCERRRRPRAGPGG